MRILVIGSGGREHAIVWKLNQSVHTQKIYCAPGNGGIAELAECVPIKADDIWGLLAFAKREQIDLTIVGPEVPLVAGIVDIFKKEGLKVFGPVAGAAQLEGSKSFAKQFMKRYGVPTAKFEICSSEAEVDDALAQFDLPVVVKADGLAAGKGVVIAETKEEVHKAAREMLVDRVFGPAGEKVVIEECLKGEEASILVLTDGHLAIPLVSSQDHKRAFDEDKGPNTGGMGAYSPAPVVTSEVMDFVMEKIVGPVIDGMRQEGVLYKGILYVGIMVTQDGPYVLEFNVRFGDPETQAVLARLKSDLAEAILWTIEDHVAPPQLVWDKRPSVCVVVASGGYPGPYEKDKVIKGLDEAKNLKDTIVFHAGTKRSTVHGPQSTAGYLTDGGRVLGVTALGDDLKNAVATAYRGVKTIHFDKMHYRRDIGWRAFNRVKNEK